MMEAFLVFFQDGIFIVLSFINNKRVCSFVENKFNIYYYNCRWKLDKMIRHSTLVPRDVHMCDIRICVQNEQLNRKFNASSVVGTMNISKFYCLSVSEKSLRALEKTCHCKCIFNAFIFCKKNFLM